MIVRIRHKICRAPHGASFHQLRHQIAIVFCLAEEHIIIETLFPVNVGSCVLQLRNGLEQGFSFFRKNDLALWNRALAL